MDVYVGREHAENIVVFVEGFAEVATFLFVPPVGVGVAELTFFGWGVDVAAVHVGVIDVGLGDASDLSSGGEEVVGFEGMVGEWAGGGEGS